ncbi:hypothetical protein Pcinc_011204 [Petrolisthes cinctipes]|uniref:DDE-1 domain-containing protein n=1 Tax=Petrolisthes cinctipes TaxID=88211 RepID=A0AAE1G378_PETCI|nr:hypothetical protein Pcinc_011204 [Petrolisthes cinctipes]
MSIRAVGRKYNIPEATLRHKLSGYHSMDGKRGPKPLLSNAEEEILVNYIKGACRRAHPVTKKNVLSAVERILQEAEHGYERKRPPSFTGNTPKQKWWTLFLKRHPTLSFRTPEALTSARKNVSVRKIQEWFTNAHDYFSEINALDALQDPARNFNIDESGFCLSPIHGKVVIPKGEKHVFEETSIHHKQNLTVLGCICADGSLPPPMKIYPRKRASANIVEKFPVGYEFTVGKSEKGYITYETLFEYLCNSFHDWLNAHNVKRPVIVWTDWHETRNNYFLAKTLNELNIILYGLPPNTTHFLQPLDVSVFGPLKKEWTKAVKLWEQHHHDEVLTQINFAEVFLPVYYSHVTPDKIKAGFDKCGLLSFNPERPDYSKLQAAAAQKEHYSTIFEGLDQGGFKEIGTQTCMALISRGTQTNVASPVTTTTERKEHYNFTGSMCDLVIEYKAYAPLKETCKGASFIYPTIGLPEFVNSPPPMRRTSSDVSPHMGNSLNHKFYPGRRPGHGPKVIRNELDRVFSISSNKIISHLQRQRENKENAQDKKGKKATAKKGTAKKGTAVKN